MMWLALRMVLHNRVRLAVSLIGVALSAYLTLTEVALYIGMMQNATAVLRHAGADLWVASRGIQNFDFPKLFPEERQRAAEQLPEVLWARPIVLSWGFLKLPSGAQEQVEIVGYDPRSGIGGPWDMLRGDARQVLGGAYIILDDSATRRLGDLRLGSTWELNDREVQLVGISRSALTFTTAPMVFTAHSFAQEVATDVARGGAIAFVAIKLRAGSDAEAAAGTLRRRLPDNDVLSTGEFLRRTIAYWTVQTGMGASLFLTAALSLVVGAGVVGQTVYANTIQFLAELATLKAIGARGRDLSTVILGQAAIGAVSGYGIAVLLALLSRPALEPAGVTLALGPQLLGGLFVLFLATGAAAALVSVRRVRRLDPAMVFRG